MVFAIVGATLSNMALTMETAVRKPANLSIDSISVVYLATNAQLLILLLPNFLLALPPSSLPSLPHPLYHSGLLLKQKYATSGVPMEIRVSVDLLPVNLALV